MSGIEVKLQQYENAVILANAVQVGSNVIRKVAGNAIADGFEGERLDVTELNTTLAVKIKSYLTNPSGGQK